jgi:predicted dehydrogenase
MMQVDPEVRIVALADPAPDRVRTLMKKYDEDALKNVKVYPTAEALLEHADQYDGVIIGTRCFMHTPMACLVAPTGLPLYLEKPVSITPDQLTQLAEAFRGREDTVVVSFPLRATPLFVAANEIVKSGRLGTINQIQANNNVPYGGTYYGNWYRNYDQTGGLWLQKATHDFDYLTLMLNRRPLMIAATTSQLVYGGDKPHDLRCRECDEVKTCSESHINQKLRGDGAGMVSLTGDEDHDCCFSKEILTQDAGSAMILYEGGAHISYTQNFVSRRGAGKRGAVVTGHEASLEFDWMTEKLIVRDHFCDRVDEISVKVSTGHMGGDHVLSQSFIDVMRGEGKSISNINDALMSVAMCLAARESAYHHTFQPIVLPGETAEALPKLTAPTEVPVY